MVILGIVAVIAIVGLVLLFVQHKSVTGQGIYGGAIKGDPFPYWTERGVPQNRAGPDYQYAGRTDQKDLTTHWNFEGSPKRNPAGTITGGGDIPSIIRKCGSGMPGTILEPLNRVGNYGVSVAELHQNGMARGTDYYGRDVTVVLSGDAAGACVVFDGAMVRGTI